MDSTNNTSSSTLPFDGVPMGPPPDGSMPGGPGPGGPPPDGSGGEGSATITSLQANLALYGYILLFLFFIPSHPLSILSPSYLRFDNR